MMQAHQRKKVFHRGRCNPCGAFLLLLRRPVRIVLGIAIRDRSMDKDRIEGTAKQAMGSVKEAFGKLTGDAKTQAEGAVQKTEGKVQNAAGSAKDGLRDAADK